jgi:hypothetical protein
MLSKSRIKDCVTVFTQKLGLLAALRVAQRLVDVLLVVSAIVNSELDLNPNLFVKNIE